MNDQSNYPNQYAGDETLLKLRDIEEKQRILKNRLLLIGENLIEIKEETNSKIIGIKKDIQTLKQNMERLISFLETASSELTKFAKKEDLDILAKQMRMFQPLQNLAKK